MANNLQPKYTVSESDDALTLYFTDSTGVYDADDNPGGYGTPNADYSDGSGTTASYTKFLLYRQSGTLIGSYTATWAPASDDLDISLTNGFFGGTEADEFSDGVYQLDYEVYDEDDNLLGSYSAKFLLYAQTFECLNNQTKTAACGCGCDETIWHKLSELRVRLHATRIAAIEEAYDCADSSIKKVKRMCENLCEDC